VRRQQLIEATIESIAKFGISGTTMTTVTGFAGLSVGIVNFHFDSVENLFEETLFSLAAEHRDI
jgi:TetR/AcrR family transcriptional repressor of bet genes